MSVESETLLQNHFSIIRQQISRGNVKQPIDLLKKLQLPSTIDPEKLLDLKNLRIIQTLHFVSYLQPTVFNLPVEQWSRECLCVEILAGDDKKTIDQIVAFYQYLTQFEFFKNYTIDNEQRDVYLQAIIRKQRKQALTLSTINQILIYIKTQTDQPLKILQSNDFHWFEQIRCNYLHEQLEQYLSNLSYPKSIIDQLVQRLAEQKQLSAELIEDFIRIIHLPEHILTFVDLIKTYSITHKDLINLLTRSKSLKDFNSFFKQVELIIVQRMLANHWSGSQKELKRTRLYFQTLLNNGWTLKRMISLFNTIKTKKDLSENLYKFVEILKVLVDYNIDGNIFHSLQTIFLDSPNNL